MEGHLLGYTHCYSCQGRSLHKQSKKFLHLLTTELKLKLWIAPRLLSLKYGTETDFTTESCKPYYPGEWLSAAGLGGPVGNESSLTSRHSNRWTGKSMQPSYHLPPTPGPYSLPSEQYPSQAAPEFLQTLSSSVYNCPIVSEIQWHLSRNFIFYYGHSMPRTVTMVDSSVNTIIWSDHPPNWFMFWILGSHLVILS